MAKSVKVSYLELSDSRCIECKRPLKKNLKHRQPEANRCYVCEKLFKGIAFIHKKGKRINLKEIQAKQKTRYSHENIINK